MWGLASRTDFDLKAHQSASKQDMTYLDPSDNSKYLPYVIEPSVGVDRLFLAILANGYEEEELDDGQVREVFRIEPILAPIKIAVLPLVKKLNDDAMKIFTELSNYYDVEFDDAGSIGKRYRRYDAIGTPWCVTFDYDSLDDKSVTLRHRDTMEQERISIESLKNYFDSQLER